MKGETRREAVHRFAAGELGIEVVVEAVESLGAFEHLYDTSDAPGVDSKHYLANGYVVDVVDGQSEPDDQHDAFRAFRSLPEPYHEHVRAYVEAPETVSH
ncbi:hypothetical protein [Halorubrum sp. CBA1229]|uniref:hypothetical protein n=1 Tax=Halorubrum sp. CBA1229 TaxID=1853699 RepID=UPI0020CFFB02|nr:hypothetical protein [Halorubrum sp. CBA1229]